MSITIDLRELQALKTKLDALRPQSLAKLSKKLAKETLNLIEEGFRDQSDPYGNRWAALKAPRRRGKARGRTRGGHRILSDTGGLKRFRVQRADGAGFKIAATVDYAVYHQSGTRKMVARRVVPDESGLPPAWLRRYDDTVGEWLSSHLGGRGR
jgi:phage virion morphogenesis protein